MARTKQTGYQIGDSGLSLLGAEDASPHDVSLDEVQKPQSSEDLVPEVEFEVYDNPRDYWHDRIKEEAYFGLDGVHVGDDVVTIPTAGANYTDAKTVAAVQKALHDKGYDVGSSGPAKDGVDGVLGPKTKAAIKKMQADASLTVTGIIDEGVIMALKVTPGVLPPGVTMEGRAAVQAQAALDAATAVEHAATPADVATQATQVAAVVAAAAPPPPPAVQEKVTAAVAQAKAAKTPAQVQAAKVAVQSAAADVHAAVKPSWFVEPAWAGGPARWQVGVGVAGGTVGLAAIIVGLSKL